MSTLLGRPLFFLHQENIPTHLSWSHHSTDRSPPISALEGAAECRPKMESLLLSSFPNPPSSLSTVEKSWRGDNFKKICLTSFCAIDASRHGSRSSLKLHYIGGHPLSLSRTQQRSVFHQTHNRKWSLDAASGYPLESEPGANNSNSHWNSVKSAADAFYRFSRPHTVIGTTLSIISVSLLAVEKLSDFSPLFFVGLLEAVVAAFFMNIYIVGLNQLSDIDIDKVNKPYLPLASGEYSVETGILIVSSFSIMSFWLGWIVGSWPLFWALFISFVLGTAYSLNIPPLRWKRSAVVAAMCILAVRAVIVQIAFFLHIQSHVFGRPAVFSRPVIFATAFMSFFSVVIALFKDIPDIDGDKIYGIQSFTVRLGQEKVFWICVSLLQMAYAVAILVGLMSSSPWNKVSTVSGHALLSFMLWSRAKSIDLKSKASITSFYMFIWKLFYAEYFLIPLVR